MKWQRTNAADMAEKTSCKAQQVRLLSLLSQVKAAQFSRNAHAQLAQGLNSQTGEDATVLHAMTATATRVPFLEIEGDAISCLHENASISRLPLRQFDFILSGVLRKKRETGE